MLGPHARNRRGEGRRLCEHSRKSSECKHCGGSGLCRHERLRSSCSDCGGGSICEHRRRRSKCTACKGRGVCEHAREKSRCRECVGGSVCEHSKQRVRCPTCSPIRYVLSLMRNHTSGLLRRSGMRKSRRTVEYLGCTAGEFYQHIHAKMRTWNQTHETKMTLDSIHIDHIKPCASARTALDVAALSHYTNMQPLLGRDNLAKTNRWSPEDDLFWSQHISLNIAFKEIYWPLACPPQRGPDARCE